VQAGPLQVIAASVHAARPPVQVPLPRLARRQGRSGRWALGLACSAVAHLAALAVVLAVPPSEIHSALFETRVRVTQWLLPRWRVPRSIARSPGYSAVDERISGLPIDPRFGRCGLEQRSEPLPGRPLLEEMRAATPRSRALAAAVRRRLPRLREGCQAHPHEVGLIKVALTVAADGAVVDPRADVSNIRDRRVGRCLRAALGAWRLPPAASPDEGPVSLRFSYQLEE